jgi:hypothetical protein
MDVPILKPNIKKVFIYDILKIISAAVVLIVFVLFFNYSVGSDVLVPIFETFGIVVEINTTTILLWFLAAVLIVAAALLIVDYLILSNVRYEFYPKKIVKYRTVFFILINSEDIPYGNIARVSYDYSGLINLLLKTGTVNVELTGTKKNNLKMEFIDDPPKVSQYIQKCIALYKSRYYAERTEDYRVGKIIDKQYY